ncbi:MAG: gliding motility-associated C-terminal domain-containing protein [Bacteroidales bacterium]|nr:gliding motility-associated C-terminal domain-containing protein [Bacteroidales bacterium]
MKNIFIFIALFISLSFSTFAQTGTEFWFAPPNVTDDHHSVDSIKVYITFTCLDTAADVTISQPANPGFTPITFSMAANSSHREDMHTVVYLMETKPTNTVLNTGLLIQATHKVSVYYEYDNHNNPDIFALKGKNALGQEFYIPLHNYAPFHNNIFADTAYASFDIVATEDNTNVRIYPPRDVNGHSGLQQFTINLDQGQTYSCAWTGLNYDQPSTHPYGSAVVSDKPIAISIKDDSNHNPSGGCYDLMGDQIIPTDILGQEYIVVKGQLNGGESIFILATQNNTEIYINGSSTPVTNLFAGETFRYDLDGAGHDRTYVYATEAIYVTHVTGFGCEEGVAVLPSLNCAGSKEVSFSRSTTEGFFLTLLVKNGSQGDFVMTPASATIDTNLFDTVPGTGGVWVAAIQQFNTTEIPVGTAFQLTNTSNIFAMGMINGGATSGCRYGYFSEFVSEIFVNAGSDQTVCANSFAQLNGSVSGGVTTGQWSSNGSGTFSNPDDLNATYTPSYTDGMNGSVILTLTSTGMCFPTADQMTLTFDPAPTVDAGVDQSVCSNNPDVLLAGTKTVASGIIWSGGVGTFAPNNTTLNAIYTPTAAEISAGSLQLNITTTGNGSCNAVIDSMTITFTPAPTVNAGVDQTVCANNADITLNGTGTVATAWQWNNGTGSYNPGSTALNTIYTPSAVEISNGSVTLTLITTAQGNCNAVSDDIIITFSASPIVDAGSDQTKCANNSATTLNGSVSAGATTGTWSGGSGSYSPNNNTLNAVYTPSAAEITNGSVTLTLTSTGNGSCIAETDQMTISFTLAPTVDASIDQTVCANNADVTLNGSITIASGAIWSGGGGTFAPNSTTLNATYSPTAAEISSGSLMLYLTTTGNGTCVSETDSMLITFTPAPTVNAGVDQTVCANNADVTLNGTGTVATAWQWNNGTGSYNPGSTALNTIYSPSAAEIASGSIMLTLITTAQGNCNAVSDDIIITFSPSPVVDAGSDQTKCGNNSATTLNGSVSAGASTGTWSGGLGTFVPDNNTLNAVYTPTATEISNNSVTLTLTSTGNGTCIAESDQMTILFTPSPTADANIDQTVCGNNSDVALNGSVTVASGGIWSGGLGTFSPNDTTLNAVYIPTATEITAGTVSLTLTTTGNGTCTSVSDQMDVTIDPSPIVNAGADQHACENNSSVVLAGSVVNAGGGMWSGGAGSFSPNNTTLTATYTPTAAEIASGSVMLTLTSTANGNCLPESDDMTIVFDPAPTVDAGVDQTLCANNATIHLIGSVTIASGGQWTGGLGIFSPDNNTLNAFYTPTATEIANGLLILHLTTTGNGTCNSEQDDIQINFTAAPTVDAGIDQTVCANNSDAVLSGTVTVASGGTWSGGMGTFLPNNNNLNVTYTPSASEILAGNVTLTLTTTGNGNCVSENDDISILINPSPVVNAGVDEHSCENNPDVQLNGSVLNAGGGVWSGGSGTFNPNNSTLNAIYTPSAPEIATGNLQLTLTSSSNGTCNPVSDNMMIYIDPAPIVNAGADQTVCANNADVVLNGSVTNASGGAWTGGLGAFTPNNSVLNATYTPTATEIANGSVTLTLTSTGNGTCNSESDDMVISFTTAPTVDAGNAIDVCANNSAASLNGNITIASGGIWSGGTGTFSPDNTTLNATYNPSAAEINTGAVTLTLTSTGNGTCLSVNDTVNININPAPSVAAGVDQSVCVDNMVANLSGSVSGITNTGQWSSNGTGSFVPNNTTLNASYTCSSQDSLAGSVILTLTSTGNGVCLPVSDSLTVYILPAGIADAGSDQTVCANDDVISLNGSVTGGAVSGVWTTSGSGVFVPNDSTLNANYIPSTGDTAVGTVTLTLTANSCNLDQDDMIVTITPAPYIDAGTNQTVCVDNLDIQLDGEVHGGTSTAVWSTTGTGSFDPNNTTIDAIYHASSQDSINLGVDLILTSTNNGNCLAESDTIHIDILPAGIVDAGQDQTMCSNNVNIQLNGSVSGGATQGQWGTSGSGTFVPSDTSLNAQYIPSSADLATGSVTLVLSATNSCNFAFDALQVNFTPAPTADAGADQSLCGNNADLSLNGSITVAMGGLWNSSGTGTFVPDNTTLNAVYVPSQTDINNGGVIITLTTTGNSGCNAESDSLDFTITPAPNVSAGVDQTVCITAPSTQLYGYVSGGTSSGQWTTMGSGSFSPNDTDLNTNYVFSAADSAAGSVQIVLTSTNNGNCLAVSDTMTISFGNTTFAYAGVDQTVCANNLDVQLNGLVSGGTSTGIWSTTGSGTFSNATDLNAIYTCSTADSVLGTVDLILTTTNNGGCTAGVDTMTISIVLVPIVNAGTDIDVCLGIDTVALGGTAQNTAAIYWETLGSGSFSPNDSVLNVFYLPSSGDSVNGLATIVLHSTGNQSCSESSDTMVIHFMTPLIPDFTNSLACNHHTVQFSDNSTVTTGSITGYEWNFEGNLVYAQDTSYIFDTTGTFDVSLTVTSSLGCSYSVTKPVEVHDVPQVSFTNTSSCYLDAFDFTDMSSISSGTVTGWTWTFGNGDTLHIQNPSETFANAGTYNVTLIATSNMGCSSSSTQQIEVYPPPTANFSYVYDCQNSSVSFTDNSSATGQTLNSWNWNFGDGNNATDQNPTHIYGTLGGQTVTLIVGSSQNCTDTMVQYLNLQFVTADFDFVSHCKYDSIQFTNLSNLFGDTTTTYYWTFDDGNTSVQENPSHLYQLEGSYDVTLQITTQSGCQDTTMHTITVYPVPVAGFDYSAEELATGYTISFADLSSGANSWQWNFGDVITSSIQNPEHIYNESGNFTVVQVVGNEYGCVDTASTVLIIAPGEEIYPPKLPNAFSPNGDGQNDVFYPRGGPFTSMDFSVYNSWGEKIFSTTDITGGWDGTRKGVDQPVGTYVWTLKAVTADGKEYTKSGDVTLIR